MPEIIGLAAGALHHLTESVTGLEIDAAKMRENLDVTRGLILAEAVQIVLGSEIGRIEAQELLEAACKRARVEKRHLREVLAEDATVAKQLAKGELERLFARRYSVSRRT